MTPTVEFQEIIRQIVREEVAVIPAAAAHLAMQQKVHALTLSEERLRERCAKLDGLLVSLIDAAENLFVRAPVVEVTDPAASKRLRLALFHAAMEQEVARKPMQGGFP